MSFRQGSVFFALEKQGDKEKQAKYTTLRCPVIHACTSVSGQLIQRVVQVWRRIFQQKMAGCESNNNLANRPSLRTNFD